jgi:glycolate oxidase FAD binding subunit
VDAVLLDKLRAIVGPAHVLSGVDLSPYVLDGRTPEAAVFPGSIEEIRAVIAAAGDAHVPVMAWGGGTAVAVGRPPRAPGIVLGLRRLNRLLEHEPGDLTATVQGGMVFSALQATLRERGQWVSLDPPDPERATLGGVIAANASGPRRHLYGTARDLLIGLTVVTGDAAVVRGGGKVVKNVAGYDLPKLFIGSHGTLGVIVDLTLKLRPRPEAERWLAVPFDGLKDAAAAVRNLMMSDLIPTAIELLDAEASRGLEASLATSSSAGTLVVGFDGLREQVDWQCDELRRLTIPLGAREALPLSPEACARLGSAARDAFTETAAVMRVSTVPSQVAEIMGQGAVAARARGLTSAWSAHAGAGVLTGALALPRDGVEATSVVAVLTEWRAAARASGGYATLEWAPLAVKSQVPVWDDLGAAGRLMQRIKERLDPHDILSPGRFLGGA